VINNWDVYKEIVIGDLSYRLPIYNSNDYEHLMNIDGEYADHIELEYISGLYSSHIFRVYRSNDLNAFVDYSSGAIMCNLFFSGNGEAGHYSVLVFGNNMNIQN